MPELLPDRTKVVRSIFTSLGHKASFYSWSLPYILKESAAVWSIHPTSNSGVLLWAAFCEVLEVGRQPLLLPWLWGECPFKLSELYLAAPLRRFFPTFSSPWTNPGTLVSTMAPPHLASSQDGLILFFNPDPEVGHLWLVHTRFPTDVIRKWVQPFWPCPWFPFQVLLNLPLF